MSEPVAFMLVDKTNEYIRSIMAVQHDFVPEGCVEIPLYDKPQKYCTLENNAAYEKGFIDGMARQRDTAVQKFVEGYASSLVEGTKLEAIRRTFGESSPKKEGETVSFDLADINVTFPVRPEFQNPETTYVERRVPVDLEDKVHNLIDQFLKANGHDPEQI